MWHLLSRPAGSTRIQDCICGQGYYNSEFQNGLNCTACPPGGKCPGKPRATLHIRGMAWHGHFLFCILSDLQKKNLFFTVPLLCWFQVAMLQYQSKRDIGLTILLYMRWPPIMFFQFSNATLLWHVPAILTWRALKAGEGSYAPCVDTITQKQMWKKSTFYSLEDASTACEYSLMRFMLLAETTDSFIYGQYQHWADRSVSHMHPWQTKGWCEWWLPSYEITYMPLCTLPLMQVSVSKFIHFY